MLRMWSKGNCHALLAGLQIGAAAVENTIEGPKKM